MKLDNKTLIEFLRMVEKETWIGRGISHSWILQEAGRFADQLEKQEEADNKPKRIEPYSEAVKSFRGIAGVTDEMRKNYWLLNTVDLLVKAHNERVENV